MPCGHDEVVHHARRQHVDQAGLHRVSVRADAVQDHLTLDLVYGMGVPVSRSYADDLKAQGWLSD